jgi:hypothetical protein
MDLMLNLNLVGTGKKALLKKTMFLVVILLLAQRLDCEILKLSCCFTDQQSTEKPIRKSGQRSPKAKADVKDAETRNAAMTKVDNLALNLNSQQHVTLAAAAAKSTEQKTMSTNNAEPRNTTRKSLTIDQVSSKKILRSIGTVVCLRVNL